MAWKISGQYMETCNCDFVCPCPTSGLTKSTHGMCMFAMGFRVDRGNFDGVGLDGAKFVILGRTPGNMIDGNWDVGLIVDDAASDQQRDALGSIVSGQAGGPMANIAPLIGKFLGIESRPIQFEGSADKWSVKAGDAIDQAVEGARGLGGEVLHLDNAGHPASNRLALAHPTRSHFNAFGIQYDEPSGRNNGHFAPFDWSG